MPDKYDAAIAYLRERPEEIVDAWFYFPADQHPAHCLFAYCSPSGTNDDDTPDGYPCGCLTQVRASWSIKAWTPELTEAIRRDVRIPTREFDITVADLEVFAEWQRRLDKELGRA